MKNNREITKKGFTLLELMVAIVLSLLIIGGLIAILSGVLTVWTRIEENSGILKESRLAMHWLTRDIREKKIVIAGSDTIEFSDVKYVLEGSSLKRNDDLVANNIKEINFSYDNPENIRFVSILLKVKKNNKELEFQNGAYYRNYEEYQQQ